MKSLLTLLSTLTLCAGFALASPSFIKEPTHGVLGLGQLDCISFAPEGVLLIGDGQNHQVLALLTGDTEPSSGQFKEIPRLQSHLAEKLGVKQEDVDLLDMAVNPASGNAYLAVRKQDDKTMLLVRLTPDGEIQAHDLQNDAFDFARIKLPEGDEAPVNRITDVVWSGDRLVAAARCNEEFASKIFAAEAPLVHDREGQIYSAETYHISHKRWETKAPMSVMIPYQENGKHYIVGAFSCTPVVKYPIEAIVPGAKIKGISMIELGSGNRPLDMFAYGKEGGASVITNTFRFHHEKRPFGPSPHVAFRFDEELLAGDKEVNETAIRRLDQKDPNSNRIEIAETFHGVIHMDRLNDSTALALREAEGDVDLVALALP